MTEKIERTLFFIKPDCENPRIDKSTALEIAVFLEDRLGRDFKRVLSIRIGKLPKEFYLDFYRGLEEDWPDILEKMSTEFAGKSLAVFVYEGPNIIQRVKAIAGATRYQDNVGENTIRERFGNQDMGYRNVVHASDREGVEQDFNILEKWSII